MSEVANILSVYDNATAEDRAEGAVWYATARDFAAGLAFHSGLPTSTVCGIIAALSPQRPWGDNQRAAHRLCMHLPVYGLGLNTEKAERIRDGETVQSVLTPPNPKRLTGQKVRAFYANLCGEEQEVTIDRHAACIAGVCDPEELKRKGRYAELADAYRAAAALRHVTPAVMQATTWVAWRALKHPNNREAYS